MPAHIESIAVEHGVEVFSSSQSITDSSTPDCEPIFKKRKLSSILSNGEDHVDNANDMDTDTNAPFVFTSDPSRIPDLDQFSSGPSSAATSEYSDSEDEHETDISSLVTTPNGEVDAEMAVPATTAAASVKKPEIDMNAQFRVKRLSDRARVPTRGSARAAGYDLYSAEKKIIPARGKALVDTQLSIAVPEGTYGRVAPRSGLASKFFIDTGAGVVDADYRGTLFVLLFNHSDKDFEIQEGDRVAQLILERIMTPDVLEVDDLEATDRGAGGFGSTGGHGLLKTQ